MKIAFSTALFLLLYITSFSQTDSTKKSTIWLRPSIETGVSFIRSDYLKNAFATNSTFNWGFGIRIGDPIKNDLLPFIQYSNSRITRRSVVTGNQQMDSVLRIGQIIGGVVFPIKRFGTNMLRAKAGFIHSSILDYIFKNSGDGRGLQLGLGYETKLQGKSRVYIDWSYDLIKFDLAEFRDYDLVKLTIGIVL